MIMAEQELNMTRNLDLKTKKKGQSPSKVPHFLSPRSHLLPSATLCRLWMQTPAALCLPSPENGHGNQNPLKFPKYFSLGLSSEALAG